MGVVNSKMGVTAIFSRAFRAHSVLCLPTQKFLRAPLQNNTIEQELSEILHEMARDGQIQSLRCCEERNMQAPTSSQFSRPWRQEHDPIAIVGGGYSPREELCSW